MTNDIIFFTGDEYADYILTKLIYWLEDHENIYLNEFEKGVYVKFYDEANLEKFVELVFDAYPLAVDTPNIDYDIEWCWNEFLHSSAGRYAKAWLEDYSPIIESAYFLDDLDKPTIAETMDFIERPMEEFFTKNPIGKKLSKHDKQVMINAIENADIGEFNNGYTWGADEFTEIIMTDHDGEHDYNAIRKEKNDYMKYAKDGKLISTWYADFNGEEVLVLYSVDLEEIGKNAL